VIYKKYFNQLIRKPIYLILGLDSFLGKPTSLTLTTYRSKTVEKVLF
jgi:hypothetical protein